MTTSLMNDTTLIQGVTKKLLKIVEIIFTHSNQNGDFEVIKNIIKMMLNISIIIAYMILINLLMYILLIETILIYLKN